MIGLSKNTFTAILILAMVSSAFTANSLSKQLIKGLSKKAREASAPGTNFPQIGVLVLRHINEYRQTKGIPKIKWNGTAYVAAKANNRSEAAKGKIDTKRINSFLKNAGGYSLANAGIIVNTSNDDDNIAQEIFDILRKSSSDKDNMLSNKVNLGAVAVRQVSTNGTYLATYVFHKN